MTPSELWNRYQKYLFIDENIGLSLDISRIYFEAPYLAEMESPLQSAYAAMDELEKGVIANPDEKRMVGHYWLRAPELSPSPEIRAEIESTVGRVEQFAADIHSGKIKPPGSPKFTQVLAIGIGGSALGPMFVADALGQPGKDAMKMHFIDNTDPDGIARALEVLKDKLGETLVIVTSKSGGTPDTRNGMLLVADGYKRAGLDFAKYFVAITMPGSNLDKQAASQAWLQRFPMFDWVGGRTSELSAVGLLPAALQGLHIRAMLAGAAACDAVTRRHKTSANPAGLLALMWFKATNGQGEKDMVVLPYKDRLLLFSRYLQQLVMESLGKREDRDGKRVDQGLSVYGNKGSTDQHAFVQQLRDGLNNFFVIFIRVLEDGGAALEVEAGGVTAGDYLHGFLLGTREALYGNERQSITITIPRVDAFRVGVLIALFERTVGLYASLIQINAYHQPGVEAGKKAAAAVLQLQQQALAALSKDERTAGEIAKSIGAPDSVETVYLTLQHLAANGRAGEIRKDRPEATKFVAKSQ